MSQASHQVLHLRAGCNHRFDLFQVSIIKNRISIPLSQMRPPRPQMVKWHTSDCVKKEELELCLHTTYIVCFHSTEVDDGGSLGARGRKVICMHTSLSLQPLPFLVCIPAPYFQAKPLSRWSLPWPHSHQGTPDVLQATCSHPVNLLKLTSCSLCHTLSLH